MRELWQRLGTLNQISLLVVFVVVAACLVGIIIVAPLVGAIISVATIGLTAFCFWFFFHDEARNNRLRRRGQAVDATILEVTETGVTVQNNYPLAKLRLLVQPVDGEPYEVTTKCLLSRFEIPAYQPGGRITVLVDPKNKTKVAVE